MRAGSLFVAGLAASAAFWVGLAQAQDVGGIKDVSAVYATAKAAQDQASAISTSVANLAAQVSIIQGSMPAPCGVIPSPDTLAGSVGSGNCYTRPSDTRPTVVQAALATTNAQGQWAVNWKKSFATDQPFINPQPINTIGAQPMTCNVTSSTASTASGQCWMQNVMTLPVAVSLQGLQLVGTASGIQVRVAGRDLTQ